nr:ParA family protein [Aeromicrobium senzhongii]
MPRPGRWHNVGVTTTLALANQKGGVAKTTSVASIGAALAQAGQRVLLVDLDPQGSLTFSLGIDPEELEVTVAEVLLGKAVVRDALVTSEEGLDLLPANVALAEAEENLISRTGREQRLRVALAKIADEYDWIVLDCPPALGVLTVGALSAADEVLIPLQAETLSHRGVGQLLDTIHDVRRFTNPDLVIRGVLATMYDGRTAHARNVLAAISETYDLEVIDPPIPKTIRFAEAPAIGRTILSTARSHKGAEAYRDVARVLMAGR